MIMVAAELGIGHESRENLQSTVMHHWMLDPTTAYELSASMPLDGHKDIQDIIAPVIENPEALARRDENRQEVIRIFNGESDKNLIIIGPCSLDMQEDYAPLFDYIEELQAKHPNAVIAWRGNGAKPRSAIGPTGTWNSLNPGSRKRQLEIYKEAYDRGIPILTEITDKDQFAHLAPYLTAAWMGARDMNSTELRKLFSATRLPVMVKNSTDGRLQSLWDAYKAITSNTEQNKGKNDAKGAGVNLGDLARLCRHEDGGPAMFTVGEGNPNVAFVARGYELREEVFDGEEIKLERVLKPEESEEKAFEHLGNICMLAAKVDCQVILDGSHKVPEMFMLQKDSDMRFLDVLPIFRRGVREKRIKMAKRIRGYLGEVSVSHGTTDRNVILTPVTKEIISDEINEFELLHQAA
jgi:hypothetical protein